MLAPRRPFLPQPQASFVWGTPPSLPTGSFLADLQTSKSSSSNLLTAPLPGRKHEPRCVDFDGSSLDNAMTESLPELVLDTELRSEVHSTFTILTYTKADPDSNEPPQQVEEVWRRKKRLGSGGFGTVWLEICGRKSRAIKEIDHNSTNFSSSEIARELEAIAKFSFKKYRHRFVQSYGWYKTETTIFVAMEYLDHGDLSRYMTKSIPELEVSDITLQLVEGLGFMHGAGFVHRDLKPKNILVRIGPPKWWVKIADFGISRRVQDTAGITVGTGSEDYMAPEIQRAFCPTKKIAPSPAIDMWALGTIAWRLMTKKLPFRSWGDLAAHVSSTAPLSLEYPGLSAESIQFIGKTLIVAVDKRITAAEAAEDDWIQKRKPTITKVESKRDSFMSDFSTKLSTDDTGTGIYQEWATATRHLDTVDETEREGMSTDAGTARPLVPPVPSIPTIVIPQSSTTEEEKPASLTSDPKLEANDSSPTKGEDEDAGSGIPPSLEPSMNGTASSPPPSPPNLPESPKSDLESHFKAMRYGSAGLPTLTKYPPSPKSDSTSTLEPSKNEKAEDDSQLTRPPIKTYESLDERPSTLPVPSSSHSRSSSAPSNLNRVRQPSEKTKKALSQVEKSVTHQLVAIKHLLEGLTEWAKGTVEDGEISDRFVRLGYEFHLSCRHFNELGIDTADLGNVPELLRPLLEDTLSQDASQESLDRYLPRIRDIIISLLHGLKGKQRKLRLTYQTPETQGAPSLTTSRSGSPPRRVSRRTATTPSEPPRPPAPTTEIEATESFQKGEKLYQDGSFFSARIYLRLALTARENLLGKEHEDTITNAILLADSYFQLKSYAEEELTLEGIFTAPAWKLAEEEEERTLQVATALVSVCEKLKKPALAEKALRLNRTKKENIFGPEHRLALQAGAILGEALSEQNEHAKAEDVLQWLVPAAEKHLKREDIITFQSGYTLGRVYYQLTKFEEAKTVLEWVEPASRKMLGSEHKNHLRAHQQLGQVYYKLDMYKQAEIAFRGILFTSQAHQPGLEEEETKAYNWLQMTEAKLGANPSKHRRGLLDWFK